MCRHMEGTVDHDHIPISGQGLVNQLTYDRWLSTAVESLRRKYHQVEWGYQEVAPLWHPPSLHRTCRERQESYLQNRAYGP